MLFFNIIGQIFLSRSFFKSFPRIRSKLIGLYKVDKCLGYFDVIKKSKYINIYDLIFLKTCTKKYEIFNKTFLFYINFKLLIT